MRYPLFWLLVLGLSCSLLFTACQRERRLVDGLYITHDGQVAQATPALVKGDRETRLRNHLRLIYGNDLDLSVSIRQQPSSADQRRWKWQELQASIEVRSGIDSDTAPQLRDRAMDHLRPHVVEGGTLEVTVNLARQTPDDSPDEAADD